MKHDITKLHPIHQKTYKEFVSSEFTPNEVPDKLYNLWVELNKHPQKDWNKESVIESIKEEVDNK